MIETDLRRLMPRLERASLKVARLGPRVLLELLLEIGCANDCMADAADRLLDYSQLTPDLIWLTGADRMIHRSPVLVPTMTPGQLRVVI